MMIPEKEVLLREGPLAKTPVQPRHGTEIINF
jgi:hypothetical protein